MLCTRRSRKKLSAESALLSLGQNELRRITTSLHQLLQDGCRHGGNLRCSRRPGVRLTLLALLCHFEELRVAR